jgi:hypothetical protein
VGDPWVIYKLALFATMILVVNRPTIAEMACCGVVDPF